MDEATPGSPIVGVDLRGTQITDADLGHLKGLEQLCELSLQQTRISDAGLVHLTALRNLQVLSLGKTQVTDAGLVHLKGMTGLRHLHLGHTGITDAGLAQLQGLTEPKSCTWPEPRSPTRGWRTWARCPSFEYYISATIGSRTRAWPRW